MPGAQSTDLNQRLQRDLTDSYDEELELELDDRDLDADTLPVLLQNLLDQLADLILSRRTKF